MRDARLKHEQGKLLEAAYFLERMQAVLEEPDEFQYNLSAFLSAARSIAQYETVVKHEDNLMSAANRSSFVYVTVIRTTPEKLWEALTDAKFIRQYWFNAIVECGWKKGSPWRKARGDGSLTDSGEILEIDPPRRMVIRWQGEWKPEFKAEGPSRCTLALEPMDGAVKLTSTHEIERPESKFITALSEGWPLVLSNLKSLLETGEVAMTTYPGH